MRALGYDSRRIATLFIIKALVVGLLGAALGFALGTGFALQYGADIFKITIKTVKPLYSLFVWALLIAPTFAALASFMPTMLAVTQDPALTLRQE